MLTRAHNSAHDHPAADSSAVGIGVPFAKAHQRPSSDAGAFLLLAMGLRFYGGRCAGSRKARRFLCGGTPTRASSVSQRLASRKTDSGHKGVLMGKTLNLIGQRFGKLVVRAKAPSANGSARWECICDCGGTAVETTHRLTAGERRSCGCLKSEPKHGHATRGAKSRTYRAWESMMSRCYRPSAGGYQFYGGRGIKVCERWHAFPDFLSDMGECAADLTLERNDANADYGPGNCRWATRQEQDRNKRDTRFITINGRTQCLLDWTTETGINYETALNRLQRGWEPERAITEPANRENRWRAQEDALIRAFYPTEGTSMVGRLPGRTPNAVQRRAARIGVKSLKRGRGAT